MAFQGTTWKVVGSGIAIMSLSSIRQKPAMEGAVEPHPLFHPLFQLVGGDAEDLLHPEDVGKTRIE